MAKQVITKKTYKRRARPQVTRRARKTTRRAKKR